MIISRDGCPQGLSRRAAVRQVACRSQSSREGRGTVTPPGSRRRPSGCASSPRADGIGMNGRVDGKIAIVTGAASGIGRACARRLANEGAKVVLTDRDGAGGRAAADALGAPHVFRELDVTDPAAWASVVGETVHAFGRVDVLVNAAGIGVMNDIERTTLEEWRLVNSINSGGTFLGCQAALRAMKASGGGSIVNVSSVAGIVADPDMAAYCASKG